MCICQNGLFFVNCFKIVHYNMIELTLVIGLFCVGFAQAQVGDFCTFRITGTNGVCKLATDCPLARMQANLGIDPTICGYQKNVPIVCCDADSAPVKQQNAQNVQLENGVNLPDMFNFSDESYTPRKSKDVIQEKCKIYKNLLNKQLSVLSLVANEEPTNINTSTCDHSGVALIVGGKPADDGEFPHMAGVGFKDTDDKIHWNCGGTLISERFVLSAAHCADSRFGPPVKICLGTTNIEEEDSPSRQDFDIVKILRHPNYVFAQKYNDIVLFEMDRATTLSAAGGVRPACLWTEYAVDTDTAVATGWGLTEFGGDVSKKLQKVTLKIFANQLCRRTYEAGTKGLPRGVTNSMLCAGDLQGGRDTCSGDSGGPLVITKDNNQCVFYLVGVTSFGRHCAAPNTPAVYTRVSSYMDWIVRVVWPV